MQRRVVVTGVGLLTSVGIGTKPVWEAIKGGINGIGPITAFDATDFNCRIAGEVKGFNPGDYIEKKEIKKMGRFIQFAIAASDFAMESAQLKVTPEEAERVGVYIGSGIGGFEVKIKVASHKLITLVTNYKKDPSLLDEPAEAEEEPEFEDDDHPEEDKKKVGRGSKRS